MDSTLWGPTESTTMRQSSTSSADGDEAEFPLTPHHLQNPDLGTVETYANFTAECLKTGYLAFNLHLFIDLDRDIEVCRLVADHVGDEMVLMLEH